MATSFLTEDDECFTEPPPFRGSLEDHVATRKRQRRFLLQALRIATRLSQNPVTLEMLDASLPWLEREQYDHLADERNAFGNCGYPLCLQPRGASPAQQYRILYKRRRVYDITDRKRFCSDWCYSAFHYVREQIPCDPSWCRTAPHPPKKVNLLSKEVVPEPGDLVLDPMTDLHLNDSDNEGQSESSNSSECDVSPQPFLTGRSHGSENRVPHKLTTETCWGGVQVKIPDHNLVVERKDDESASPISNTGCLQSDTTDNLDAIVRSDKSLDNAAAYLKQWLTQESIRILTSSAEETCDSDLILPSLTMEILETGEMPQNKNFANVLPLIDSVSVNAMRRQILMEVLTPSIHKILSHLDLPHRMVIRRLENAISAFRLSSRNIHMPRDERLLLALALLCVMAVSNPQLVALNDAVQLLDIIQEVSAGKDVPISDFKTRCVIPFTNQLDFDAVD